VRESKKQELLSKSSLKELTTTCNETNLIELGKIALRDSHLIQSKGFVLILLILLLEREIFNLSMHSSLRRQTY